MNPKLKTYCKEHVNISIEYFCLEPTCEFGRRPYCPACLAQTHKQCRPALFVKQSDIVSKIDVSPKCYRESELYKSMLNFKESRVKEFKANIDKLQESPSGLQLDKVADASWVLQYMRKNQNNICVEYDAATDKLKIRSKLEYRELKKQYYIHQFEKRLAQGLDDVFNSLVNQELIGQVIKWQTSISDLAGHNDLQIKLKNQMFHISRNSPEDSWAFLVYSKPLSSEALFKVSLKSANACHRQLDLGVIDLSCYNSIKQTNYEDWGPGFRLYFYGFAQPNNALTKLSALSSKKPTREEQGNVVYFEYNPGSVAVYNENRTLDISCNEVEEAQPLYFFLLFYCKEASVRLERIY